MNVMTVKNKINKQVSQTLLCKQNAALKVENCLRKWGWVGVAGSF